MNELTSAERSSRPPTTTPTVTHCLMIGFGSIAFMYWRMWRLGPPPDIAALNPIMGYVFGIVVTAVLIGRRVCRVFAEIESDEDAGPGMDMIVGWVTYWGWVGFSYLCPWSPDLERTSPFWWVYESSAYVGLSFFSWAEWMSRTLGCPQFGSVLAASFVFMAFGFVYEMYFGVD